MEKPRVLSGEALVAKGITKIDASLPEVGLKDVIPNGSWLEQKQIQAALEARKYLIEVERIEKCGTLSHAEWRDDLMLAEVTQKAGGHWQYLGHNVGKKLYLRPEEALFLMEVNCLLLKHNEVTVSLQKAYSLLLSSSTTMIQYKVYASLSRLGYRVFRHTGPKINDEKKTCSPKAEINDDQLTTTSDESKQLSSQADASTENKTADVKAETETNQEGSSNMEEINKNVENTSESMEICTENRDEGNVLEKENDLISNDIVAVPAEEQNSMITSDVPSDIGKVLVEESDHISNGTEAIPAEEQNSMITSDVPSDIGNVLVEESDHISSSIVSVPAEDQNSIITNDVSSDNGIVLIEESGHASNGIVSVPAEEQISMITSDVSTDNGNVLVEESDNVSNVIVSVPADDQSSMITSGVSTDSENVTQKVYFSKDNSPCYLRKIDKLTNRQIKPSDPQNMDKYFENIPDFSNERVATVNVPEQQFIPKNIFVNKGTYTLNLQNIKMRSIRSMSSESPAYTSSDEVNGTNIRRIRSSLDSLSTEYPQNPNFHPHMRFQNFPRYHHFRPYGYWRPQNNLNFYQLMFFQARVQAAFNQRPHMMFRPPCFGIPPNNLNMSNNARKRMRNGKFAHFQGIKNLAVRLKQSLISGNTDVGNLQSLHSLLHSYNLRYKTRLRLTDTFDVVNEEKIVETIDLDDDEETKNKKPRLEKDDDDKFDENLYRLRQLALRLRDLEANDNATASHRRAFSKAIKTFNKSYNADIYLDDVNYEVIDRRCITLDSSSESDCVVEEQPQVRPKKLRNPFNILKRRKEKLQCLNNPGTSKDEQASGPSQADPGSEERNSNKYSESIVKTFSEAWLPNENDFGRAEVVPKRLLKSRLEFSAKEQFLFEYKNDQFKNWLETKISFLRYLEETNIAFKREQARILADVELCNDGLKPLIDFEDSSDMPSVLEKLRIIENNKETKIDTSLRVDFDVYNRNVQNFRKKNPPKPHFRIICLDESSGVPSAAHVMSLHSKYDDNVPIVFAIVSIGSISYLQINTIDLPIYVPNNDAV
ncbi:hypothetical protein PYW08_016702 [Mythimna loreyi]|uniref:Uncharacterized protein n=1 Tax=Mythimna loreyi TaxID=667449 RepID=A0ACC2QYY2_9NEOP|nr:hypothetical protein PYW08_016702 [Mythimna loreyi]